MGVISVAKKSRNKYTRAQSRSQRITLIITAVIAVIMVVSMIIAMLPPPPSPGLLLPGLWF
jgi:putative copper export protein